jgi:protein-S-isoprenylcysteine O-methyltransferase Ste14
MIMKTLAISIVVVLLSFGCATMKSEGAATLHVECNVPDAAVLLDDALAGRVADLAKKDKVIRAGFYRVEIRHPGYHSYFTEITVAEGGVAAVKAELHPLLD